MTRKKSLDVKDLQILNTIMYDGRITNAELSKQIGLTESPTFMRVQNLINDGIIKRFRAEVDLPTMHFKYSVVINFKIPQEENVDEFIQLVDQYHAVFHWFVLKTDYPGVLIGKMVMAIAAFRSFRDFHEFFLKLIADAAPILEMSSWIIEDDKEGTFQFG